MQKPPNRFDRKFAISAFRSRALEVGPPPRRPIKIRILQTSNNRPVAALPCPPSARLPSARSRGHGCGCSPADMGASTLAGAIVPRCLGILRKPCPFAGGPTQHWQSDRLRTVGTNCITLPDRMVRRCGLGIDRLLQTADRKANSWEGVKSNRRAVGKPAPAAQSLSGGSH